MRLYTLTPESGDAVTVLRLSQAEAGVIAHLLCTARPRGRSEAQGLCVIVDAVPAEPRPEHEAVEER